MNKGFRLPWNMVWGAALALFCLGMFSTSAQAQGWRNDRWNDSRRPSEQWVRQQGYENGVRYGFRRGAQDINNRQGFNYRTREYDYALIGFRNDWIHDDNYKRGFRDGYRDGYQRGFAEGANFRRGRVNRIIVPWENDRNWNRGRGTNQDCRDDDIYWRRN